MNVFENNDAHAMKVTDMIVVYTDGAMDGEGRCGIGIVIQHEGDVEYYSIPIGVKGTNQEAEFEGVLQGLRICAKKYPRETLSFRTDARIVVDTIEKNFTRNKVFQPYITSIQQYIRQFPLFFIKWIPEIENKQADRLARQAIVQKEM